MIRYLFISVLLVAGCGKVCELKTELVGPTSSKTLETLRCPDGQFLQWPVVTKTMMNGDIVSYDANCVRTKETCQ